MEKTKQSEEFLPENFTKFEQARIIGARALQISMNAPLILKLSKKELEEMNYDPIKIAEREFREGVLPITVKRPLPQRIEKIEEDLREESDKELIRKEKLEEKREVRREIEEGEQPEEVIEEVSLEKANEEIEESK